MDTAWEWNVPVPSPGERLLLVALISRWADEPDGAIVTITDLQALTGMSGNRIRRAREWLISQGICRIETVAGYTTHYWLTEPTEAPVRRQQSVDPPVDEVNAEVRQQAIDITKRWWARAQPKPLIKGGFPVAMKMAERAILAGWAPEYVEEALPLVPTLSAASLEWQLRLIHPVPKPLLARTVPSTTVDCQVCGSSGRYRSEAGWRCVQCDNLLEV